MSHKINQMHVFRMYQDWTGSRNRMVNTQVSEKQTPKFETSRKPLEKSPRFIRNFEKDDLSFSAIRKTRSKRKVVYYA